VLAYRKHGGARPCPGAPRGSMLCVVMEPASVAARPTDHRSLRRRAAGPRCATGPRPPTRPRGSIPRPRLVRRLREARDAPFVLLVAPAGYGKTTLLSEWAAWDERRFAWIDLGAGDHDPERLLTSVKRRAHHSEHPTVLVVDNAHLVGTPETFHVLDDVARSMPSGSQLALASRCEPGLPVGSLRAHRRIFELRTGDMAMTRSEASALLTAAGIRLASDGLDRLMDRTEGWPAGLYLAALSLRAQPSVDAALSRFAGDDRVVAEYLRDELMARLEPDHVDFLLRTSILNTLSGPLCDAVLGHGGSGRILGTLAQSNVLLVSLDRGGTSYRYHPLFREMLHSELRRLDPGREPELHARASAWHEEHGDLDSAIHHAVAAGNPEHSGELLWRHASSYIGHGRNEALAAWLNHFTDDQLGAVPSLAVAAASSRLAAGDGEQARHWAAAAGRGLARRSSSKRGALDGAVALLRALLADRDLAHLGRDAAHACALASEHDESRSFSRLLAGASHQLAGDRTRARAALGDGARSSAVAAPHVQALCLSQLALLEIDADDWDAAAILTERARSRVEGSGLSGYPIVALVYAVSALTRSHSAPVADADRDMRTASRLVDQLVDFVPWYEAETRVTLARASLGLSDVAGARSLIAEAARLVRRIPESPTLRAWVTEACSQLEAATGSAGDGLTLTAAELRVLRMLPTHLSFPAIAKQLFVSPNTVKTHVRALYRKLDASSRSEAVSRAAAAGLLDGLGAA
jgi:LuxR family transcriptional regulator, maltose regulon positive regulatory protein